MTPLHAQPFNAPKTSIFTPHHSLDHLECNHCATQHPGSSCSRSIPVDYPSHYHHLFSTNKDPACCAHHFHINHHLLWPRKGMMDLAPWAWMRCWTLYHGVFACCPASVFWLLIIYYMYCIFKGTLAHNPDTLFVHLGRNPFSPTYTCPSRHSQHTLGARGQLPSGSMLSIWKVLKQFTQLIPSG